MGAVLNSFTRNVIRLIVGTMRLGPRALYDLLLGRYMEKYSSKYNEFGVGALKNDTTVNFTDFKDAYFISKDGTKLHAVIDSKTHRLQGKRSILMVHGFPELWISWLNQLKHFSKLGHPVMALSMRGYGLSDKPKDLKSYDKFVMIEDIRASIQYLANDSGEGIAPLLVAHDWGAAICWEYAKQGRTTASKEIAGYASLSTPPKECFRANLGLKQKWASLHAIFFNMSWLPEKIFLAFDGWFLGRILNGTKTLMLPAWISSTYRNNCLQDGAMTTQLNYYRASIQIGSKTDPKDALGPQKGRDKIRRLDLPVLMIRGKDDRALTDVVFKGYDRYLSNAKLIALDDCSHWIQADKSPEVNKCLEKFLEEL